MTKKNNKIHKLKNKAVGKHSGLGELRSWAKKGWTAAAAASLPSPLTTTRSRSPCAVDGSEILGRHVLQSNYLLAYSQH